MITHDHDHIRLPRLDTNQLVSAVRMRFLEVWKDFSAPEQNRPEHNVRSSEGIFRDWVYLAFLISFRHENRFSKSIKIK